MKRAILVISFGTSYNDTLEKTIGAVEKTIGFKTGDKVSRAFTSEVIINKIYKRNGIKIDTVKAALQKLYAAGYTDIFCVPTYIMNGMEYDKACMMANEFSNRLNIKISRPLISQPEDYFRIVDIFKKYLTDRDCLYVFMGHGSEHFANLLYSELDYHFKISGMKNVFVKTIEGFSNLETVIEYAKKSRLKNVVLRPFLLVSGSHARNDMCGEWKKIFEENGFNVRCDLTGLGEIDEIQEMYFEHLRDIWER